MGGLIIPKAREKAALSERYKNSVQRLNETVSPRDRWMALDDAAMDAFNTGNFREATQYAEELKSLTPNYEDNWNYGNAIHDYNLVFGLIALESGDIEGAKRFLIAAGKTPGSPQLDSFGPDMSLAEALLIAGERQAVLEYFDLCQTFWPKEKLSKWKKEMEAGKIPDF